MSIHIKVDVTNPGQYFACCGLLELADRLWPGAEGWFEGAEFCIGDPCELAVLVDALHRADISQVDEEDNTSTRVDVGSPFRRLRLDWWRDETVGGKELKVWAGTMESYKIARAMQGALSDKTFASSDLLNVGQVVYDADDGGKKVEPYYFDARRCSNAHSRDVGFATNDLSFTTTAYPAVELLCLIGLQRCLPRKTETHRIYDYFTWSQKTCVNVLPGAVCGLLADPGRRGYRFENWFRTGQKKHKSFRSAVPLS